MAKYEKRGSSSRTKRKKIEALPVVVEAGSSYIDELIRVQKELQEALFTYMRFPKKHWVHLKTTTPIESLFATVRLRTRAARRLRTRTGTVCLVFQLLRNNEPRRKIRGYTLVGGCHRPTDVTATQETESRLVKKIYTTLDNNSDFDLHTRKR